MPDSLADLRVLRLKLRSTTLRAMLQAVQRLEHVAMGEGGFRDDRELRACLALAGLASSAIAERKRPEKKVSEPLGPRLHPSHSPAEADQLLDELLEEQETAASDEAADTWAARYRSTGPNPPHYTTEAEARDYGRKLRRERKDRDDRAAAARHELEQQEQALEEAESW